jgi:signal transduction histidine kinase
MSPYSVQPLITALIAITLGLFVFVRNPRSKVNLSFFLLCLSTFWWQFTWVFLFNTKDPAVALLLCRFGYTGIVFIPITFYYFVSSFLNAEDDVFVGINYAIGAAFVLSIWTTDYFVRGQYQFFWGYYPKAGFLHAVHLLQLLIITIQMVRRLVIQMVKVRAVDPIRYNQAKFSMVAVLAYFPASIDYAVNYGLEVYPFGFIFALAALVIFAFAIIKYNLLDINIVITKTATYFAFSLAAAILGFLILYQYDKFIIHALDYRILIPHLIILTVFVCFAIFLQPRFYARTQDRVKQLLFKDRYDYQKTMLESLRNKKVLNIADLKQLLEYMLAIIRGSLNVSRAAVLVFDGGSSDAVVKEQYGYESKDLMDIRVPGNMPALRKLEELHRAVAKHELGQYLNPQEIEEFYNRLRPVEAMILLPLIGSEAIAGVMCFDNKSTGDIYSTEDIELLDVMANQMSIVIDKIRLGEQLVEREKMAFVGTIAHSLAHEFNNPLTSIDMFVKMIPKMHNDASFMDKFDACVPPAIKRISEITQDMLAFSQASNLTYSRFNVSHLVEHTVELLSDKIRNSGIAVEIACEEISNFPADVNQLSQVLVNLLINAIQASQKGGKVRITAKLGREDGNAATLLFLSIIDEGEGIKSANRGDLFKPFSSTKIYGTGLGLPTCRRIIEAHGGRLEIESEEGKGSRVTIVLPGDGVEGRY